MLSYFTSESVTSGYPDKLCDKIADSILDEILRQDPSGHVACEVTATSNKLHIMGEITANASVDYNAVARRIFADTGYTEDSMGFESKTCEITIDIHEQSPDIARGLNRTEPLNGGAGDQGMMFGYACKQTKYLMPFTIEYANKLTHRLEEVRKSGELPYLRPDGKSQVTVEYEGAKLKRIVAVIISAQHGEDISIEQLREDITEHVIRPVLPERMIDGWTDFFINPTGRFVIGGPVGDTGLTGRKIIADTYGGYARHGGGSFSGKDATKVDRSAAYMARYIAKNIVAAGIADNCEVQLSYAIGLAEPVSVRIDDFGTGKIPIDKVRDYIIEAVDMRPMAIIRKFELCRPIFSKLSCYGHFGENAKDMPWESCDMTEQLSRLLK
ncbi:MAG TPA: methionine adenosyltransferase [Bacteroidales bacterium]|jgi:S-adenosylmethionine synthetase|nr:methionine adenosyltransferase [Bacteroidales bacterium]